jgi:hypothetical protein
MSLVVVADYRSKPGRWADVAAQTQAIVAPMPAESPGYS